MPYKSDKLKIGNERFDRRVKLLKNDKENIRRLYKHGLSMRQLAKIYMVDKKTIKFVVNQAFYQMHLKRAKEIKKWRLYYDRSKNNVSMRKHRRYKYELYKKGLLKGGENI